MRLELAPRSPKIQIQRLAARDHEPQHLVHQVLAECSGAHDVVTQLVAHLAQHARRLRRGLPAGPGGEYLEKQLVGAGAPRQAVARELALVMLAQGRGLAGDVLYPAAIRDLRSSLADLLGELVDELKLRERRPAEVFPAPR